jgi:hyperosmotically inducible protein
MKVLIATAFAAALAIPAYAQQKAETKAEPKLPTADERAKNRETVSKGAASAALTTKVKTALAKDAGFKTLGKIDVDSADGVVTLKGRVESAEAKKKAEQIAKQVDGVKSVKNQLRVEAAKKG